MKKSILIASVLLVAASAMAQTNVLSRNAVGYIRHDLKSNQLFPISIPFKSLTGGPITVTNMFNDLPNGTSLIFWNPSNQTYDNAKTITKIVGLWLPATAATQDLTGKSFFLRLGGTTNLSSAFVMGEVPDSITQPTQTVALATNAIGALNFVSLAYPVMINATSITFAGNSVNGDQILVYDPAITNYKTATKIVGSWFFSGNWPAPREIKAGEAFWIRSKSVTVWGENKPYLWP